MLLYRHRLRRSPSAHPFYLIDSVVSLSRRSRPMAPILGPKRHGILACFQLENKKNTRPTNPPKRKIYLPRARIGSRTQTHKSRYIDLVFFRCWGRLRSVSSFLTESERKKESQLDMTIYSTIYIKKRKRNPCV